MAIYSWFPPLKTVIFHSYVSLPEGILSWSQMEKWSKESQHMVGRTIFFWMPAASRSLLRSIDLNPGKNRWHVRHSHNKTPYKNNDIIKSHIYFWGHVRPLKGVLSTGVTVFHSLHHARSNYGFEMVSVYPVDCLSQYVPKKNRIFSLSTLWWILIPVVYLVSVDNGLMVLLCSKCNLGRSHGFSNLWNERVSVQTSHLDGHMYAIVAGSLLILFA